MSSNTCAEVVSSMLVQLQRDFEIYEDTSGCVIVTPFPYPDQASIEIQVCQEGDRVALSDSGETLDALFVSGLELETKPALYRRAERIVRQHGAALEGSEIRATAAVPDMGKAAKGLVDAIQAVAYLVYRRTHRSRPTFSDEVEEYLLDHDVHYQSNFVVQGVANRHLIPIHVNSSRNLLIEPITASAVSSARTKARATAFKWIDIHNADRRYRRVTVLDDRGHRGSIWSDEEAVKSIKTYSDAVVLWEAERSRLAELVLI